MRGSIAATAAALLFLVAVPVASAAPIEVDVRIEGKSETLFEGPVLAEPHRVRDFDDSQWRRCNGVTSVSPLKVPSVVPTSVSSDAMRILGETFDGRWFGQYEDYYVERWGPDPESIGAQEYWGVLVNNVYTSVGGCQYPLDGADEVVWAYDAFHGRPRLLLYPAGYAGGAVQPTATATLNQPFQVVVDSWSTYNEGTPPPAPTRSTSLYAGAEVAPVETGPKGFQRLDLTSPQTAVTGSDGRATIVFTEPGWHRIKATDTVAGKETVIRSNRLDVCVPAPAASDCGAPPADAMPRTPPPMVDGEAEDAGGGDPGGDGGSGGGSSAGGGGQSPTTQPAGPGRVRLQLLRLDRSRLSRGQVRVSWRVLDPGAGIAKWAIASKAGRKGARWVERASGRGETAATVRLPAGTAQLLKLTVVDVLGESAGAGLGRVQVPR
jgi:uncharacterized membrane protein YgcG